jgi:hypothetical protein
MFWNKKSDGNNGEKLSGPKDIPQILGQHLVVKMGKNPDWVWALKATLKQRGEKKNAFDVRVFEQRKADEKKIKIKDYNSFAEHPELILFEGWFDKENFGIQIEEKSKAGA